MMTGNEVRETFLKYFEKKNHRIVRSSSLVPADDPTLLFTNAGMVQFKRLFLGEEKRDYNRATTSQKCVRAGGKHNDLENVGYTARHHTFFEMLGNFSFGDYFKEGAIEFAWELLIDLYGLPADKMYASIFLDDDEAHDLWRKVTGIPEERIVRFDEKDNFWAMGDTGPCGPCSELLLDRGEAYGCDRPDCQVGCECDRYLEIWNLVFMQFNRDASGKMTPLPKPSIDTGMGLERLTALIQDVPTNYDTDLMSPVIRKAEELSQMKIGESHESDVAMKVISDHSRAMAFLIGDGVLPSNEGRGYVLRRIMRRAIRYGRNIGLTRPFLHDTARVVFDIMKPAYPELSDASSFITNVIKNEEIRFSETLDHGLRLLSDTISDLRAKGETVVPGSVIFKLYDTYGFPVDIVQDVVRDEQLTLDMETFDQAMAEQRERSRSTASFAAIGEAYKKLSAEGIKPEFVGYDEMTTDSKILALVKDGEEVREVSSGQSVELVTETTPFYGEAGGQIGDRGKIYSDGFEMEVEGTLKDPTGLIIHRGQVISGSVAVDDTVTLSVDMEKRSKTACNHTATHILHWALREVLGDHVKQSGSLVEPERLRFDFTHFSQVAQDELEKIELMVNERIAENVPVATEVMGAEDAFKSGATALFEEKYGEQVRVVSLSDFSKELCGGTHTSRTGDIGAFKIVEETSISAGVRRMEALTGREAIRYNQKIDSLLKDAAMLVKDSRERVPDKIERILTDYKALEKEIAGLKSKISALSTKDFQEEVRKVNGIQVLARKVEAGSATDLRNMADHYRDKLGSGVVVLGSVSEDGEKALLVAAVTKDLTGRYHAGDILKKTAAMVGGGGGGRPDMAQAGGSQPENLDKALDNVYEIVEGH